MKKCMLFTLAIVAMTGTAQAQQSQQLEQAEKTQFNTAIENIQKAARDAQAVLGTARTALEKAASLQVKDHINSIQAQGSRLKNLSGQAAKDAIATLEAQAQVAQQKLSAIQDIQQDNAVAAQVQENLTQVKAEVQKAKKLL